MTNSFCSPILSLGSEFYDPVMPAKFPAENPRFLNDLWSKKLNLDGLLLDQSHWIRHFCRFEKLSGFAEDREPLSRPLALRYHGHQFQHYNPDLGDGRGFLFAQLQTSEKLYDFGTKGSGTTPYSRQGDGRLTLKGAVREALATEMLESLGVTTSKTFCFFETGEQLVRGDEPSPTRSAVLTRLSHGHIRFGTFQRLAFLDRPREIKILTDYCLQQLVLSPGNSEPQTDISKDKPSVQLLTQAIDRTAKLVAQWIISGFVHGVLNTDNMNITGESFDYGPYRFLPHYDPGFTAAYFDHSGLYCYGRQPAACLWNLQQLGRALQTADPDLEVDRHLQDFSEALTTALTNQLLRRLNLASISTESDLRLLQLLFTFLESSKAGFEQTLFDFFSGIHLERWRNSPQQSRYSGSDFDLFFQELQSYSVAQESLHQHSFLERTTACTLLIDEIENIWSAIAKDDDWNLFDQKIQEIRQMRPLYEKHDQV